MEPAGAIDDLVRGGAASGRDDGSGEGPFAPLYRKVGSDRAGGGISVQMELKKRLRKFDAKWIGRRPKS